MLMNKAEWFRYDGGGAAGVETVGEPSGMEGVGGVHEAAAVNVRAVVCQKREEIEQE